MFSIDTDNYSAFIMENVLSFFVKRYVIDKTRGPPGY